MVCGWRRSPRKLLPWAHYSVSVHQVAPYALQLTKGFVFSSGRLNSSHFGYAFVAFTSMPQHTGLHLNLSCESAAVSQCGLQSADFSSTQQDHAFGSAISMIVRSLMQPLE